MAKKLDFRNLPELVFAQYFANENKKLLNFEDGCKVRSFSSFELLEYSVYLALSLKNKLKRGSKLAIYSYQNPIWLIVDFACQLSGLISVPIFHNISKKNLIFQLKNCNAKAIFIDNQDDFSQKNHFDKMQYIDNELPENIQNVIGYKTKNDKIDSFDDLIEEGKEIYFEMDLGDLRSFLSRSSINAIFDKLGFVVPKKNELATIVYTSGSTGNPKGVELSHDNLVSQIKGAAQRFLLSDKDRALSFLPLAHIFERMVMMFYISRSVSVFFVSDVAKIGQAIQQVKPTIMTVVPRLLEKLFAKIKDKSSSGSFIKRSLASSALNRSLSKNVCDKSSLMDKFFDRLIYKKYRQALGGEIKLMICGGAALSEDMERFYRNIGIDLFCGYGLTETAPVLAVNYKENYRFGSVGKIYPDVRLKIATDGELLAKGRGIMLRYHKNKKKNDEVFEKGWFKTGDLAQISDGYVKITGRKKELFKTSAGKYVMPVPIEQKLVQELGYLAGAIIVAEGKNFVSALLFPDLELLDSLKVNLSFFGSDIDFLQSQKLHDFTDDVITKVNEKLDRSNQILQFRIVKEKISIASGDITPSMKLKRQELEKKYKYLIDEIYSS